MYIDVIFWEQGDYEMNGQWHQSGAGGEAMKYKMFTQSQPLNIKRFSLLDQLCHFHRRSACLSFFDQLSLLFQKYNESQSQNCTVNMETINKQSQARQWYFDQKLEIQMIKWQWASEGCNLAWKLNTRILHCTAASVHVQSVWLLSVCVWV